MYVCKKWLRFPHTNSWQRFTKTPDFTLSQISRSFVQSPWRPLVKPMRQSQPKSWITAFIQQILQLWMLVKNSKLVLDKSECTPHTCYWLATFRMIRNITHPQFILGYEWAVPLQHTEFSWHKHKMALLWFHSLESGHRIVSVIPLQDSAHTPSSPLPHYKTQRTSSVGHISINIRNIYYNSGMWQL